MVKTYVITVIGPDRPGLVELISETVAHHGGNWLESRMARLAGQFAGVLLAGLPDRSAAAAQAELLGLASEGLKIAVEASLPGALEEDCHVMNLELLGHDRPGIVREVARALASHGINVDELETECRSASMSGETLFHASARLLVPKSIAIDALRETLERLANELMVDINVEDAAEHG